MWSEACDIRRSIWSTGSSRQRKGASEIVLQMCTAVRFQRRQIDPPEHYSLVTSASNMPLLTKL